MTNALLDANTLIAAFDESHASHGQARAFLESVSAFYTDPQVQGAFLRFFTRPWTDAAGNRREPRMSMQEALDCLEGFSHSPSTGSFQMTSLLAEFR